MTPGEEQGGEKASFSLQYLVQFVRISQISHAEREGEREICTAPQVKCPKRVSCQIFAVVLRLSTDGPYHSSPGQSTPHPISTNSQYCVLWYHKKSGDISVFVILQMSTYPVCLQRHLEQLSNQVNSDIPVN